MDRAELQTFVAQGLSLEQIARAVGCHQSTVANWLAAHGLRTVNAQRFTPVGGLSVTDLRPYAEAGATFKQIADAFGTRELRRCPEHGDTLRVVRTDGYYRCLLCVKQRVADRRRQVKEILIAEAGGECIACGYDSCPSALHFHHVDPSTKSFAISSKGFTRSLEAARAEVQKCVLVCSNCHAEIEAGLLTVDWAEAKVSAAVAAA
jgi:hypothetical protein